MRSVTLIFGYSDIKLFWTYFEPLSPVTPDELLLNPQYLLTVDKRWSDLRFTTLSSVTPNEYLFEPDQQRNITRENTIISDRCYLENKYLITFSRNRVNLKPDEIQGETLLLTIEVNLTIEEELVMQRYHTPLAILSVLLIPSMSNHTTQLKIGTIPMTVVSNPWNSNLTAQMPNAECEHLEM